MPATTKVPLGPSTTVRKWYLDVNTGTFAVPVWVGVFGIQEFKPTQDDTYKEDSDFDSGGFGSETKTSEKWGCEIKIGRKTQAVVLTAYDPGQEYLRTKSQGQMGPANQVDIRYYEMEPSGPRVEAYRGYTGVQWSPDGGEQADPDTVSVTLRGQGRRNAIAHPTTT